MDSISESRRQADGRTEWLFFPGFLARPSDYRGVLNGLVRRGGNVRVAQDSPGQQLRSTGIEESVRRWRSQATGSWLLGHSRGAQVAYRIAADPSAGVAGLVLVDPVAGSAPGRPAAAMAPPAAGVRSLTIAAGRGGRCNPADRDHRSFSTDVSVVLPGMGHVDFMEKDLRGVVARLLCGSNLSADFREEVLEVVLGFREND
ncbi:MAG: hypothetical protein KDC39_06940 [Actinobacteria bacterium]|nr:hypothetical protein [Actinomycetota bacterium]